MAQSLAEPGRPKDSPSITIGLQTTTLKLLNGSICYMTGTLCVCKSPEKVQVFFAHYWSWESNFLQSYSVADLRIRIPLNLFLHFSREMNWVCSLLFFFFTFFSACMEVITCATMQCRRDTVSVMPLCVYNHMMVERINSQSAGTFEILYLPYPSQCFTTHQREY